MNLAALVLAVISFTAWVFVGVGCAVQYRKAKPTLTALMPMLAPFAARGDAAEATASRADLDAVAVVPPDRCEYDEHIWSKPTPYNGTTHYCTVCGYSEPLPGA